MTIKQNVQCPHCGKIHLFEAEREPWIAQCRRCGLFFGIYFKMRVGRSSFTYETRATKF